MNEARLRLPKVIYLPRLFMLLSGGVVVLAGWPGTTGAAFWLVWLFQFIAWPHLALLLAQISVNPKRAEMHNLHIDALSFGVWAATIHFQFGVVTLFFGATTLTHLAVIGPRGLGIAAGLFAIGALVGGLANGFAVQTQSSVEVQVLSLGCLLFVMTIVGYVSYVQNQLLLKVKAAVERQKSMLESMLHAGTSIHHSQDVETLMAQGADHLRALLPGLDCALLLRDLNRPGSVRHAHFAGISPADSLRCLGQHEHRDGTGPQGTEWDEAGTHLQLLRMEPHLQQLDGRLLIRTPTRLEPDTSFVVQLFRDQIASALESRMLTQTLQRMAHTDTLTGAFNRAYFQLAVDEALRMSEGPAGLPFAVVSIDVNGLKPVNDTYGHQVGDALIVRVAELLGKTIRQCDLLFRMGGDEFVVLCNACDTQQAQIIVDRLGAAQTDAWLVVQEEGPSLCLPVSLSVGAASSQEAPTQRLNELADERMYAQKRDYYARTAVSGHDPRAIAANMP